LSVSVPSVVTVDAGSSKVVQVTVAASSDAKKGVYPFTVEANGQTMVFNANVTDQSVSVSAIALTVVLVIIFVALLVVLAVLLLRKSKPVEEVETSYY
jgi:cytochrome bd-type quinol oxidase subunit 1